MDIIQHPLFDFLCHWLMMSLSLWVASFVFKGLSFKTIGALFVSALVLGLVNASIRPILWILTFPLSIISLGFFALAINALMIMLVAKLVNGFEISGFWTAFFVAIFIALFSCFLESVLPSQGVTLIPFNPNSDTLII